MAWFSESLRIDFPQISLPQDRQIEISRTIGRLRHLGEREAKPDACFLCGERNRSICNSHSIPQFCLREIAVDGKVKTINCSIEMDMMRTEEGVNSAGTFRMVCRECDRAYFADYENPDRFSGEQMLDSALLGQIAVKVCLLEQYKARLIISSLSAALEERRDGAGSTNMVDVKALDEVDNMRQLDYARRSVNGENEGYRVLFDSFLAYTVPIAFQGQITLASDFYGTKINDVLNYSSEYHTEPLYICVFPLKRGTRVLVFCRAVGYARYARFHRGLRGQRQNDVLLSILKTIIGYSEEVYFSPLLPDCVFTDEGFSAIARLSNMRLSFSEEQQPKSRKQFYKEYALSSLPKIPNLLSKKYSMLNLKKGSS